MGRELLLEIYVISLFKYTRICFICFMNPSLIICSPFCNTCHDQPLIF